MLENAFKHGIEKATDNAFVHLQLIEDENKISFTVKNNYDAEESSEDKGIGLEKFKRSLKFIISKHTSIV